MWIPIKTIFQKNSGGYSSKRVCGVLGWLILMFIFIWCTIVQSPSPNFTPELIAACVGLLGVDCITDAIKSKVKNDI
jgi:hypothetical protein